MRTIVCKDGARFWADGPNEVSIAGHTEFSYRVYSTETPNIFKDEPYQARFRPVNADMLISTLLLAPTRSFARRGIGTAVLTMARGDHGRRVLSCSKDHPEFDGDSRSDDATAFWTALKAKGIARYDESADRYEFCPAG